MSDHDVKTIVRPWLALILEKDPDFYAKRKNEKLYDFSPDGRIFRGDPNKVGTAYPDT